MKSDFDRMMAERGLDAIVIIGPDGLTAVNAPWCYLVGGQHLSGTIIKRRGTPPQLIYNAAERQQALATGLDLIPVGTWNLREIAKQFPGQLSSMAEWYRQVFERLQVRGRVGFYGTVEATSFLALIDALRASMPDLELVGEFEKDLISAARITKDATEIALMADVGRRTSAVVQAVVDFISGQRVEEQHLVDVDGKPVTIGHIQTLIRRELDAQHLEAPSGTIFAQGRDAGIPHAFGDDDAPLELGQAIILDIFPRDVDSGYYHDMTRTFAIGYAPPELQKTYDDVQAVFNALIDSLQVDTTTRFYQEMACELFHERGHRTLAEEWPLEEGFVHGLGHGLGLDVHEQPTFPTFVDYGEKIEPGTVFTIEPGLYYPSRNFGVRIEDTYVCDPDGTFRSLSPFPQDLVIPIAGISAEQSSHEVLG